MPRCNALPLPTPVPYPNGGTAYEIRGGVAPSGRHILLIAQPLGFGQRCQP